MSRTDADRTGTHGAGSNRPTSTRTVGRTRIPSAPPAFLEPILRPIERLDTWRLHIRPIRPDGLIGLQMSRHHGAPVTLSDGTVVTRGDPVGELHLLNRRMQPIAEEGWQGNAAPLVRADMAALAQWSAAQPPGGRPVAYHGETILASFARLGGFDVTDAPEDPLHRLRGWYLRGVLARYAPGGRARLRRGRSRLPLRVVWLSDAELQRRFSPKADFADGR